MKLPLAVVTMSYNEPDMLPIWFSYYAREVGAEHCYILDHGTDDGSTEPLQGRCPIIKLPRTPHQDTTRAYVASKFCASLLGYYDHVIYVDADEIIVADPARYGGLLAVCDEKPPNVLTMLGADVVHDFASEADLDPSKSILSQRAWVRPFGYLCKPSFINREVQWSNGFHGFDGGCTFGDLYLLHLALCDREMILRRQRKRNMSAPVDGGGDSHTWPGAQLVQSLTHYLQVCERHSEADFREGCPIRQSFLSHLFDPKDSRPWNEQHIRNYDHTQGLWKVPERFRSLV